MAGTIAPLEPFDHFYGLYVGGNKVGWMHASYVAGARPKLSFSLTAKVAGMGQAAEVRVSEQRQFSGPHGLLQTIYFEQRSATGAVEVRGVRRGAVMELTTRAGGASHVARLAVNERLDDDLALVHLARGTGGHGAAVGATATARHLDASTQSMVEAHMTVEDVAEVRVAGVVETTRRVVTAYPALKVREVSQVDGHGKLLRTQVGGFFEARLEDEAVAKAAVAVQDVLLGAVIQVPRPLPQASEASALSLVLAGLDGEDTLVEASRQTVTKLAEGWGVSLRRDPPWRGPYAPPQAWANPARATSARTPTAASPLLGRPPADALEASGPTAYIQSEAPELRRMARRAVGDANDLATAVQRLCDAVRHHLHAEYVPAFSNALEAYHSRRGDCTEHSVLFAALARAAGLPARPVVGIAYWPAGGGFGWHAWVEVWGDGSWHQVDPTWGQAIADVTHVKLADGGPIEQASVVMLLGKLRLVAWQVESPGAAASADSADAATQTVPATPAGPGQKSVLP